MIQNKTDFETDNIARLIQTSYNPEFRPPHQTKEQIYRHVVSHIRRRFSIIQFPDIAVGILGFILILLVFYSGYQLVSGISVIANPPLSVIIIWLVLNLIIVPVAGAVIVIRRQHG